MLQAAIAAGAPKDLIGWIDQPSVELSNALMHHPDINLILATGGPGMVKAAYSSGKPAIGVGAGNTPVVIDETADIKRAVASVLMSKTFDNGVICASEQSVVVVDSVYDAVRERFASHGGYLLQGKELKAVQDIILKNGALNAAIVGQPAAKIAELAGFTVPATTKILIGEVTNVDERAVCSRKTVSDAGYVPCKRFRRRGSQSRKTGRHGRYRSHLLPVHRPGQPAGSRGLLRPNDENRAYPDQHPGFSGWYR